MRGERRPIPTIRGRRRRMTTMLVPLSEEVRMLHASDVLEPLGDEGLERFARKNPDVRLREGEILFGPEEVGERLFIVKDGRVRLYKVGQEGNEVTIATLGPGRLFGEMALTGMQRRQSYAQAMEPSLLISVGREALEGLILEEPRVGLRLAERLSERVRALEGRLEDATLKEVPARVASLLLQLVEGEGVGTGGGAYEIPTRYGHEELAKMVGANRVTMSGALGRLREAKAVEARGRLIRVTDLEALGRAAGDERRAKRIAERGD
jgi:CRP-like cAMP-binding protein